MEFKFLRKWGATGLMLLSASAGAVQDIRLATTTSTENSGLLKYLLPAFEAQYGAKVLVIPVGTGKALKLGENGDVDAVLVHSRPDEDKFVAAGFGVMRQDVMYNDFVVVGPKADPAGVKGMRDVTVAFKKIMAAQAKFISRGDDSGTHKMERRIWQEAEAASKWPSYLSAGQGMGEVLAMAAELQGYTLTDRGTYLAYRARTGLDILVENDPHLFNYYGIIAVNPLKQPHANFQGAALLIEWITSKEGQRRIADFKVNGEQLFFPNAAVKP